MFKKNLIAFSKHVKVAFLDLFRHYQLGLAHGFNKQYDESIDQYRRAIKVMEAKIGIKLLYIVLL